MKSSALRSAGGLVSCFAGCALLITSAHAEVKSFVIDPGLSSLTLSGTVLGIDVEEQGVGSLTTSYSGSLLADVTGDTVTFVGGSEIVAANSGSWQPLPDGQPGNAPANYGAIANGGFLGSGQAALRGIVVDLSSGSIPLLGGTFAADSIEVSFPPSATPTIDFAYSTILESDAGSEPLDGETTNNVIAVGNISEVGSELVLTIPVNYSLTLTGDIDATFTVEGQLVGKAVNIVPLKIAEPEISPGQLTFTIATTPGKTYSVLGSADLAVPIANWELIDQFEADSSSTARDIAFELAGQQFFILREE